MGYLPGFPIMDAKRAVSCPGSSGKLTTQLLIKDQMISHYKKIYSAKAAVDCSVPKSMLCSIKYKDQKRREQMRKAFERTSSLSSLSQTSSGLHNGVSHLSRIVRPAAQIEHAQVSSKGSTMSSPRFTTSFHSNQIVYPSQIPTSASKHRPASELTYRNFPSSRHRFTNSCSTFLCQEKFQSFQDPAQKTYSGDILLKHGHRFTQDKPFTPRTLISDHKSALSSYRYYNPPNRKATEERISAECNSKEANNEGTFNKCRSLAGQDLLQEHRLDHTWSDEEEIKLKYYRSANQIAEYDFYLPSSRVSPEGMKSPIMRKVTEEEEELMYLKFITDITNDILEQGIYTDRVLKRVFERHITMNKHRLNEDKMRHLVDSLQDDFLSPPAAPVTVLKKSEEDSSVLHRPKNSSLVQELEGKATDEANVLSFAQLDKDSEGPDVVRYLLDSVINASVTDGTEADDRKQKQNSLDLEVCNHKIKTTDSSLNSGQQNEEEELQRFTVNGLDRQLFEFDNNLSDSFSALAINNLSDDTKQETSVIFSDDEF